CHLRQERDAERMVRQVDYHVFRVTDQSQQRDEPEDSVSRDVDGEEAGGDVLQAPDVGGQRHDPSRHDQGEVAGAEGGNRRTGRGRGDLAGSGTVSPRSFFVSATKGNPTIHLRPPSSAVFQDRQSVSSTRTTSWSIVTSSLVEITRIRPREE